MKLIGIYSHQWRSTRITLPPLFWVSFCWNACLYFHMAKSCFYCVRNPTELLKSTIKLNNIPLINLESVSSLFQSAVYGRKVFKRNQKLSSLSDCFRFPREGSISYEHKRKRSAAIKSFIFALYLFIDPKKVNCIYEGDVEAMRKDITGLEWMFELLNFRSRRST
jgi:hypothetical protein